MSLDWSTAVTGLMIRGGKVIKAVNARAATAGTDLPAELAALIAPFDADNREDQVTGAYADYQSLRDGQTAARQRLARYFDVVIQDRAEVLDPLGLIRSGLNRDFWEAFLKQMATDAESVRKSVLTVGSTTAVGSPTGTGTVLTTKLLDGFNAPLRGRTPLLAYAGKTSELGCTETMRFRCIQDVGTGARSGQETLTWSGGVKYGAFDWRGEGSGDGPNLTLGGDGGLLNDGSFEQFTANVPRLWTIDLGTAGTHVFQTTAGGEFVRGTSGLKLSGNGVIATIAVSQSLANSVEPLRMYCLSLQLKASATVAAGDFEAILTGTGYTAGGTESIAVAPGALPTSFTLKSCFIMTPAAIPSDLKLVIRWKNTPTNAKNLWVDCVSFQEVVYNGGLGAVAVPGATDPIRGDSWTVALSQDGAGTFQEFFRKWYGVQVRSVAAAETIPNALAT